MDSQHNMITSTAPPIPIPPRQSHSKVAPKDGSLHSRRRSAPSQPKPRKRLDKQPAAPEVISSILDSLALISAPSSPGLDSTFTATSATTPRSSNFPSSMPSPSTASHMVRPSRSHGSEGARSMQQQYATEFVAFQESLRGELGADNTIDEGAEPPVVRTMKRREEEWMQVSAQKKDHVVKAFLMSGPRPQSVTTAGQPTWEEDARATSKQGLDMKPSFDSIPEVPSPRRLSIGKASDPRANRSTKRAPSRDTMQIVEENGTSEGLRLNTPRGILQDQGSSPVTGMYSSSPHRSYLDEATPLRSAPTRTTSSTPQSIREGKRPMADQASLLKLNGLNGPAVPSRKSSLMPEETSKTPDRSPVIASPALVKTPSSHDSRFIEALPEAGELQVRPIAQARQLSRESINDQKELRADTSFLLDDEEVEEDTDVQRRIRELKAKKEERDRLARQASDTAVPETNSIQPSNTSTFLDYQARQDNKSFAETRQPSDNSVRKVERANRPVPITVPSHGSNKALGVTNTDKARTEQAIEQPEHTDDTDRPTTPLTPTPLPIDYAHVMGRINKVTPPMEKESRPSTSRSAKSRPYLFGARGSSVSLSPDKSPYSHLRKHEGPPGADLLRRSSSAQKKKRWSSSDFGLNIERKNSMRSGDMYAVKPAGPADALMEDRRDSFDEIDNAVSIFVRSQRLSQKIIDPITGRVISFSEVGDPKGHAVFCCVGMGLTRYVTAFYDDLAATLKLRLITPDRPGVGDSQADPMGTPLSWPDDITSICNALNITKFSLLAHSAGAIYALATALRQPQNIRGKVHLLAPWIPPSQLAPVGLSTTDTAAPGAQLPRAQRFLRVLPAPFLKVANSGFLSATSASLSPNATATRPKHRKRGSHLSANGTPSPSTSVGGRRSESPAPTAFHRRPSESTIPPSRGSTTTTTTAPRPLPIHRDSMMLMDTQTAPNKSTISLARSSAANLRSLSKQSSAHLPLPNLDPVVLDFDPATVSSIDEEAYAEERRTLYDESLTLAIWNLATTHSNPAVDLVVCLERNHPIGFRYVDITRAVVVHHGAKDSRVPVENVKWLGKRMRRCEVRVLDGEGHGLMASAVVMGSVLREISREWEDWEKAIRGEGAKERSKSRTRTDVGIGRSVEALA